ncbi:MAG: HD-GYP domain-containing protein [Nitrospirae bacterium]|nr:HD-GYP domain-containing protein [Nitrospirota bacterium]
MIKKIKTGDLKVGMHVVIPSSWLKHPFLKNEFDIKSRDQIREIIESGFDEVSVDTSKGFPIAEFYTVSHSDKHMAPPTEWKPDKLIPDELKEAIHDKTLPSEKKAELVYKSSVEIMGKLFEDPKAENIKESKQAISEIVDLIVSDNNTSYHLLRITSHDFYTYTHSVNVGVLSVLLSKAVFNGSDAHNMHELGAGFFLHDLGKVRVDPAIINKPGRLTEEEMKQMRIHPYQSYKMLEEAAQLSEECRIITMQHHERGDGTGYPRRLKEDQIHVYGRICCIADVYDALTAERSYKPKLNAFEALKIMKEEMINHFHRDIFEKFVLLFS